MSLLEIAKAALRPPVSALVLYAMAFGFSFCAASARAADSDYLNPDLRARVEKLKADASLPRHV